MTREYGPGGPGSPPPFDLTVEPWLTVLLPTGEERDLSLRDVFAQAGTIARLSGDVPTQDFALLRLLLAILHDALDGPKDIEEWTELWEAEEPFTGVPAYLDDHRARFDLCHPSTPFLQVAGLSNGKDNVFPLNRLVADVPNGDPFFTVRFPGVDRLTFAEAARWLVHAHAYDTAGIKTGVLNDPRAKGGRAYPQGTAWAGALGGVAAEGASLKETLLLNLIATEDFPPPGRKRDLPTWRREPDGPSEGDLYHRPAGLRDLYTWQSRRVRLQADHSGVFGALLTYGDRLAPRNQHKLEPMTGWRRSRTQEKKHNESLVYMPREHDPERAAWRGLEALLGTDSRPLAPGTSGEPAENLPPSLIIWLAHLRNDGALPRQKVVRFRTYGTVYGTQQSVVDEIVADEVVMPVVLLGESDRRLWICAVDAVDQADDAVNALGRLAHDLVLAAVANDKRRVQGDERTVAEISQDQARDRAYGALDGHFRTWLAAIRPGDEVQELAAAWQSTVRRELLRLADDLLAAAGDRAWTGRTVTRKDGSEQWVNSASAERRFRAALNKALPHTKPAPPTAVPRDTDGTATPERTD